MSDARYPSQHATTRIVWFALSAFVLLLVGSAVALWGYYGTAVFYEMILAGIAACF